MCALRGTPSSVWSSPQSPCIRPFAGLSAPPWAIARAVSQPPRAAKSAHPPFARVDTGAPALGPRKRRGPKASARGQCDFAPLPPRLLGSASEGSRSLRLGGSTASQSPLQGSDRRLCAWGKSVFLWRRPSTKGKRRSPVHPAGGSKSARFRKRDSDLSAPDAARLKGAASPSSAVAAQRSDAAFA